MNSPAAHPAILISDSTTVGRSLVTVPNPSEIRFPQINANNTASLLSASDFRTAINTLPLDFVFPSNAEGVFEGDSLSTSFGLSAGQDWPTYFQQYTSSAPTWTNVAAAGATLNDIVAQYATQVFPRRPAATGKAKTFLFVWIGANDLATITAGTNPQGATAALYFASLQTYWQTAKTDGFTVVAFTLVERNDLDPVANSTGRVLNRLIRASIVKDYLVDMARLTPTANGSPFYLDTTHFTDDARKLQAAFVAYSLIGNRILGPLTDELPSGWAGDGSLRWEGGPLHLFNPPARNGTLRGSGGSNASRIEFDFANGWVGLFSGSYFGDGAKRIMLTAPFTEVSIEQTWTFQDAGAAVANAVAHITKATTGNPSVGFEGLLCSNTFDHTFSFYSESAWRVALYRGGALGTPASGTLTNCTGYAVGNLVGTTLGGNGASDSGLVPIYSGAGSLTSSAVITVRSSGGNTQARLYHADNSTYHAIIVPASTTTRTLTAPDVDGTFITTGNPQTTVSGNAGTATALATGRTISITGDLAYTSPSFDGTGNVTAAGTLATVASAGTTGSSTAIPVITINAKGLTTGITTAAVIAPAGTLTGATLAANVLASSVTSVGTLTGGATGAGFTVALTTSTITGNLPDARNTVANSTTTSLTGAALAITPSTTGTIDKMNIGGSTRGSGAFTFLGAGGAPSGTYPMLVTSTTAAFAVMNNSGGGAGTFGGFRLQISGNDRYTCALDSNGNMIFSRFNSSGVFQADALTLTSAGAVTITGNLTAGGALITTPQALSGAGAVNVTTSATAFTSTGAANALTLADGTNGQIKTVSHVVKGTLGTGVLTPTTKSGYTTITFNNAGDSVTLQFFTTAGWCIVGSFGAVIA